MFITTTQTLRITCHEKGRADAFEADVAADCTAAEIIGGLSEAGYLTGQAADHYVIVCGRTGLALAPDSTLEAAGVDDGDVLVVTKSVNGA